MKKFDKKINIRWKKKELERIKKVSPYGNVSEFVRGSTIKEVERLENEKLCGEKV